jgi:hypothetical protein
MNTNEKVPMNSARSLGAIRLDMFDSRGELTVRRDQACVRERQVGCGMADERESAVGRRSERADSSVDQLLLFEPEGLRDPSSIRRIRARAIVDVPLLDVQLGVAHRPRRVLWPGLYASESLSAGIFDDWRKRRNYPRQAEARITLQKLPRLKCGSLSASTSALTLPKVVSGLCLLPS